MSKAGELFKIIGKTIVKAGEFGAKHSEEIINATDAGIRIADDVKKNKENKKDKISFEELSQKLEQLELVIKANQKLDFDLDIRLTIVEDENKQTAAQLRDISNEIQEIRVLSETLKKHFMISLITLGVCVVIAILLAVLL